MADEGPPTTDGDRVMRAVRDVLVEHGPPRPSQVIEKLPPEAVEMAKTVWAGGLARLAKNMSERVGRKPYFHPLGDGRYAAGPKDTPEVAALSQG